MSSRAKVAVAVSGAALLVGGGVTAGMLDGGGSSSAAPYLPVTVGLGGSTTPVKIGVIVSAESDPHQGQDYYPAAAGVRIAEYRYKQAGANVTVTVVDDHGTTAGAQTAAKQLVADGVDAVVYASTGSHIKAGLAALSGAGTCSVLPYADESYTQAGKVWLTGPSLARRAAVMAHVVASEHLGAANIITDGSLPSQVAGYLASSGRQTVSAATQVNVPAGAGSDQSKPMVVWANAQLTADLIARVGGFGHTGITVVGPDAMTPTFAKALLTKSLKQGTVSVTNRYITVGAPTALMGQRVNDFTAAQQLASADANTTTLLGTSPLGAAAFDGDMLSHDAVISLVNAARMSSNPNPADTCRHLQGQSVVGANGLAGPDLSFTTSTAFPDDTVVEVQAAQARRADQSVALVWFPVPNGASAP